MGVELTIQQIGGANNVINEVELNSKASRATLRSLDAQAHGSYSMSSSLSVAAGNGTTQYFNNCTNINWAGLQWTQQTKPDGDQGNHRSMDTDLSATAGTYAICKSSRPVAIKGSLIPMCVDPEAAANV